VSLFHGQHGPEARHALEREAQLPTTALEREQRRGLELGLPGADSIVDKTIPTFSRGELPHFVGINTFLKAPYVEDVRRCGEYDIAVLGAPHDGGTTYRSGTRFGPQGMRRISALYGTYSFELGVDLRESVTIADVGDIFTIPGNIEKTFDQITNDPLCADQEVESAVVQGATMYRGGRSPQPGTVSWRPSTRVYVHLYERARTPVC